MKFRFKICLVIAVGFVRNGFASDEFPDLTGIVQQLSAPATGMEPEALRHNLALFSGNQSGSDRKYAALALAVHFMERSPLLALQYLSAAQHLSSTKDHDYPVILYHIARARQRLLSWSSSAAPLREVLRRRPGRLLKKNTWELLLEQYLRRGQDAELIPAWEQYRKDFALHRQPRHLRLRLGRYWLQRQVPLAIDLLESIAREYPLTPESVQALHLLTGAACHKRGMRWKPERDFLRDIHWNTQLDEGVGAFTLSAMEDQPWLTDMDGTDRIKLLLRFREFDFAGVRMSQALAGGRAAAMPDILALKGRWHLRRGEYQQSLVSLGRALSRKGKNAASLSDWRHLAAALGALGQREDAAREYRRITRISGRSIDRWQVFWQLYRGGHWQQALTATPVRDMRFNPQSVEKSSEYLYWRGRTHEKLGQQQEANRYYRDVLRYHAESYYAVRVLTRAPGFLQEDAIADRPEAKRLWLASADFQGHASESLATVRSLLRSGLKESARLTMDGLDWRSARQRGFETMTRLAWDLEDYTASRIIPGRPFSGLRQRPADHAGLLRHQRERVDEWQVFYPKAYERIIDPVAEHLSLNPWLLLSIIRAESRYNENARSPIGAGGLMQLMPFTAFRVAHESGLAITDLARVARPEVNISMGAFYLKRLTEYYSGHYLVAVAASVVCSQSVQVPSRAGVQGRAIPNRVCRLAGHQTHAHQLEPHILDDRGDDLSHPAINRSFCNQVVGHDVPSK